MSQAVAILLLCVFTMNTVLAQSNNTTCPTNEEFKTCGTACEPSCRNPNPEFCTQQCVVGCQCKSGFYRNDQNVCVARCSNDTTSTPGNTTCPTNEEFKECGTACEPSCRNPNPEVCTEQCVRGCQCRSGYYRNDENVCVSNCSAASDASEITCANIRCRDGFQCRQDTINCVRAPCPQPKPRCVPTDAPQRTCDNVRCPAGTECQQVPLNCLLPPCPQPPPQCVPIEKYNPCAATLCPVGSECRSRDVVCVRAPCNPVAECVPTKQDPQCNSNESYRSCASQCEPTCSNKNPTCILSCAPGRCQCNIGFYRNSSGSCVTEADCDGNTNPY